MPKENRLQRVQLQVLICLLRQAQTAREPWMWLWFQRRAKN